MSGSEMPRAGQVIIRYARGGKVSVAEHQRAEAVRVSGGDALDFGDGHRSILMRSRPTQRPSNGPTSTTGADKGFF